MRIESSTGDTTTLYLERGERHEDCVVGQNCVHTIFNAAGRKIELADSFVAYALSGDWRRGARVAA